MCGDCFVCIYLVCQCDGLELGRRNRRITVRGVAVRINTITLASLPLHNKTTLLLKRNNCPSLKPFESSGRCFWVPNSMSTWIIRISLMLSPILPPNVSYVGVYFWRNIVLCSITKKGRSILLLTCSVMF